MKKLYFLLFFAFSFIVNAQIVNIPDANLKSKLLSANVDNNIAYDSSYSSIKIDINNNGEIEDNEAAMVFGLNLQNSNISNAQAINYFNNLYELDLSFNFVSDLVIDLPNLGVLSCEYNGMSSLTINSNSFFEIISCRYNNLTLLDLTNTQGVYELYINDNNISTLLMPSNVNQSLGNLDIRNNNFNGLDLSSNFPGDSFAFGGNPSDKIIFPNHCYTSQYILFKSNTASVLDLSGLKSFDIDQCSILFDAPLLETIILKNSYNYNTACGLNPAQEYVCENLAFNIDFTSCPSLRYICVDEEELIDIQERIDSLGLQNQIQVNSYCTFTPGGIFYEISGNTKFDFDNNSCDVSDIDYPNLNLTVSNGTNSGSFIANSSGNYYIPVQEGIHTISPVLENPTYFNISPTNFTVDFPTNASLFTQDFCVTANGVHSDVEVALVPTNSARPGFDADYKIIYRNKGNQIEDGTVTLAFLHLSLDYVSSNPVYNSSATNTFTWNYTNLQPFEAREIEITFNVNSPMESPPVNNGEFLDFGATITAVNTDESPVDNTFILFQTVVGSYDPNDITCLEGKTIEISNVGDYVHYVIRFENTGTYPAQNIVVKDIIDFFKFDISTLVPLHGSHEFYTRIGYNYAEFIFENINLDFNDSTNDGYVAFKIKTLPSLTVGDTFSNDANIYFDYNFPITTNEYETTIQNLLNNQDFTFENEFVMYPNPAKNILNISTKNQTEIQSVEIYNIVGQIVIAIPNTTKTIDVTSLETGTYFVKVNTEKGSTTTKFVKE